MPVVVSLERLDEAGPFFRRFGRRARQESGGIEDAIDAGRTASDDVGIEHHERQAPIAFQGIGPRESADAFFFDVGEPVVARHPGVVLVDLAEALNPVVVLAGRNAEPGNEATSRDVRLVAPVANAIDQSVARVVGDPSPF